jgi:hypothetical protein
MKLLKLAPKIQAYLKNLIDPLQIQYVTEKRLRPITQKKIIRNKSENSRGLNEDWNQRISSQDGLFRICITNP